MFWTHRSFWILPIVVAAILGGLSAIVSHTPLKRVYEHRFTESRRERLFLARTTVPARPITGVDAMHASDGICAWRWWTFDELATTTDRIWPARLAELIRPEISDA